MNKKQKLVIKCLSIILIAIIAAIIWASGREKEPQVNEFVPPEFEQQAVAGVPEGLEESLNYQTFAVEDKMTFGMSGNLTLTENNTVDIYFTSDTGNSFWSKVRLLDEEGNILGESGLIKAGEYVKTIEITNPPAESKSVIAKILTYEEETYYSEGSATAKVVLNVK